MLSIVGSVLGLVTSVGPGMFKQFMDSKQDARDKEHELAMQAQMAADKRDEAIISGVSEQNIAVQTTAQAEMQNASKWTVNYAASVRPTITYLVFFLFLLVHVAVFMQWITPDQYGLIVAGGALDATFSTIIMFWFGQRLTSKWTK
tara:strand:- start:5268 stop:5705 length:438 start_codon:yes stop_codon:yes gene_type:complete